jgi:glycosyltransferase involved in cell wall biosynthesis
MNAGHSVSVKSFRRPPSDCRRVLESRGLENVPHSSPHFSDWFFLFTNPRQGLALLSLALSARPLRLSHLLKSIFLMPRAIRIAEEVRREQPDVVHAFWGHYPALALALLARDGRDRPVLTLGLRAYDLEMRFAPGLAVARSLVDRVFTHAAVNRLTLESLGVSSERIAVIRSGVDPTWLAPFHRQETPTFLIATAGRLIASKGHEDAIRAFGEICRRGHNNLRLRLLGDGPHLRTLRALVMESGLKDSVDFLGHLPHPQVRDELRQSDVFVLMSWYAGERLPNVVKEAMACGCACIVARSPGIEELVLEGQTGWILEPRDWQGLADRLEQLINDPSLRQRMGERGREWIAQEFNADTQQARYVKIWKECMDSRNTSGACSRGIVS